VPVGQNAAVTPALKPLRRIASYGVCEDDAGRILLVRASVHSGTPSLWSLPGGSVEHGEDPRDTVIRETAEETGLQVEVTELRTVLADLRALPDRGVTLHTDRIIYQVQVQGGQLRDQVGGGTDLARWFTRAQAAELPLRPFTADVLKLPAAAADLRPEQTPELPTVQVVPGPDGRPHAQRFAAYAVATDPTGRILLTRISAGYPGAGRWHLPGGGTDVGEEPATALERELVEETGQRGRVTKLLGVLSHRDPNCLGPEGYPIDLHSVRAFYRVEVDQPGEPRVVEAPGGSTCEARWFTPAQLADLPMTDVAYQALSSAGIR